jgi:hypothetical protein
MTWRVQCTRPYSVELRPDYAEALVNLALVLSEDMAGSI